MVMESGESRKKEILRNSVEEIRESLSVMFLPPLKEDFVCLVLEKLSEKDILMVSEGVRKILFGTEFWQVMERMGDCLNPNKKSSSGKDLERHFATKNAGKTNYRRGVSAEKRKNKEDFSCFLRDPRILYLDSRISGDANLHGGRGDVSSEGALPERILRRSVIQQWLDAGGDPMDVIRQVRRNLRYPENVTESLGKVSEAKKGRSL